MFGVGVGVGVGGGVFVTVHCFVCMHYVRGWSVAYSNQAFHDQGPAKWLSEIQEKRSHRPRNCVHTIHSLTLNQSYLLSLCSKSTCFSYFSIFTG